MMRDPLAELRTHPAPRVSLFAFALASAALHVSVVVGLSRIARVPEDGARLESRPVRDMATLCPPEVSVDLVSVGQTREGAIVVLPRGGDTVARPDTGESGRGGDAFVSEAAIHLADRDDEIFLSPDIRSSLDRSQIQRIDVHRPRQSWEDRRTTTHPMELSFIATGKGSRMERRPRALDDPARGARRASAASALGRGRSSDGLDSQLGTQGDWPGRRHGGRREPSPGEGVRDGADEGRHTPKARVRTARPLVRERYVAVAADEPGRPRDNKESDHAVDALVQSIVHASTAGGAPGQGRGGSPAPGETGSGARSGSGSRATALGPGGAGWVDLNGGDPRLLGYFRAFQKKLDPFWRDAFPKEAALDLKQGTVVLDITIEASGDARVHWPPVRPSGIPEFDRRCADAVRRASPFGPLPRALGWPRLRVRAPFVALNPIVR